MNECEREALDLMMEGIPLSGMARKLLSKGFGTEEIVKTLRFLRGRKVPKKLVIGATTECGISEKEVSEILARK